MLRMAVSREQANQQPSKGLEQADEQPSEGLEQAGSRAAVVLDGVSKVYDGGALAVDNFSLEVTQGEVLVLLGPSGCGKTTVLRMIAGLEQQTAGDVWLDGKLANHIDARHRNVAMVFQHGALYPKLTVRENLGFPLKAAGKADKQTMAAQVLEMARGLDIEKLLDRYPRMLSGGERQRVAIGRALIRGEPTVLLMDEPLASLDARLRLELRDEIGSVIRSAHQTTIYVTHDQVEALTLADRIAVLRNGTLQDVGSPTKIYADPATAFVAAFVGSPPINLVSATICAEADEHVLLDFGPQNLALPWSDPRAEALHRFHGQSAIVGIRPNALTPAQKSDGDALLHGRIHSLEYHGHEWLARLEVGLHLVDISTVGPRSPGTPELHGPARPSRNHGHRLASLVVRLDAPRSWEVGQDVGVAVDLSRIFVFDAAGQRIG
jgi:multiple sugar transport system ATP-binding protein